MAEPFNLSITGHDVPEDEDGWKALDTNDLAVALNRQEMIGQNGALRLSAISNQIRFVRANQLSGVSGSTGASVNIQNAVITIEDRRAAILAALDDEVEAIDRELRQLGVPGDNGGATRDRNGNGRA